jgi:DNA repair photolyase
MTSIKHIEVNSLLTKTQVPAGDYVINPYVGCPHKCLYCYAEFMKHFTNHKEDWGDFLDVKVCAKKINVERLQDKTIVISTVTDAYNPFERKFECTREILKQFVNTKVHIEILTKSDLVLRDQDLFAQIPNIRIGISLNTLDDEIRKVLEPGASSIQNRINAIKTLNSVGFDTYIFLSPMLPGISDFKAILEECKTYTRKFYFENLNLRGAYRSRIMNYILEYHPGLLSLYDGIYSLNNMEYWEIMEWAIVNYCTMHHIPFGSYFYHEKIKKQR